MKRSFLLFLLLVSLALGAVALDSALTVNTSPVKNADSSTNATFGSTNVKISTDQSRFSDVEKKSECRGLPSIKPIDTELELHLHGVVSTNDSRRGHAIIRDSEQREALFKAGDSVFGLATLEEIYIDCVVLVRAGRYKALHLPHEYTANVTTLRNDRKREAKRIVSDFRNKFVNRQGMDLIEMFGFDTAYSNGNFIGFTVKAMGEPGVHMLEILGVQDGDLITAVNGMRFAESIDAVESLSNLKDATEVNLEIQRNGAPMNFHFEFSDSGQDTIEVGSDAG